MFTACYIRLATLDFGIHFLAGIATFHYVVVAICCHRMPSFFMSFNSMKSLIMNNDDKSMLVSHVEYVSHRVFMVHSFVFGYW